MEIKLSVDGHQLSGEVQALVENLSIEQKQELAKQLLAQAFLDVDGRLDHTYVESKALESYRKDSAKPEATLGHAKSDYSWSRRIEKEETIKRELITKVVEGVVSEAKLQIKDMVKNDEKIQAVITETIEVIRQDFPKYVQNAMTLYLATQMQNTLNQVSQSLMVAENTNQLAQSINQRLGNRGI